MVVEFIFPFLGDYLPSPELSCSLGPKRSSLSCCQNEFSFWLLFLPFFSGFLISVVSPPKRSLQRRSSGFWATSRCSCISAFGEWLYMGSAWNPAQPPTKTKRARTKTKFLAVFMVASTFRRHQLHRLLLPRRLEKALGTYQIS